MLLVPDSSLLIHLGDSDTCTEWKKYDNNLKSANVQYRLHHTVVTSDGCNTRHSENYENILKFPVKAKTSDFMRPYICGPLHLWLMQRNTCTCIPTGVAKLHRTIPISLILVKVIPISVRISRSLCVYVECL